MFTGIIEAVGEISQIKPQQGDAVFTINTGSLDMSDVQIGDSIACNGVCLTAVSFDKSSYTADVSGETLAHTTLANLKIGAPVNLEKALTPKTRLGGHLVSGHVDGVGEVVNIKTEARSVQFHIKAPEQLAHYIAKKGSICVDGVSLTVNEINAATFELNLVPHTLAETTAQHYQVGSLVNLEVDLLARYLERLMLGQKKPHSTSITESFLKESGF